MTQENNTEFHEVINENSELKKTLKKLHETQDQLIQNEKLASMGRLIAGIAHEINNPIAFISSNSTSLIDYVNRIKEILNMYQKGIDPAFIQKRIQKLKLDFILSDIDTLLMENLDGLGRITSIVNNLKKLSRTGEEPRATKSDINDIIKSVLIVVKNEIKYYSDVKTEFCDHPYIDCNTNEISQVIMNIVLNASQAIKEQKRSEKGTITISTSTSLEQNFVTCTVVDDGPGIPDTIKNKIFDPFFTTKEVGKGTGLGLSICREIIVEKHKGKITVDSQPSAGTTFTIYLPRQKDMMDG